MTSPHIGITSAELRPVQKNDKIPYTLAMENAGATCELIPADLPLEGAADLIARLDGILFTGGGDINPERFQGLPHPQVEGISDSRDAAEIALALHGRSLRIPFLGICRGCQLINVAYGGSLFTHISDQLPGALEHSHERADPYRHPVRVEPGSLLARITGKTELSANSRHHQGLERIAADLIPTACAPDGLVEAIELRGHPFGLAVQWHPEDLTDQPEMAALFAAFIQAAGEYHDRAG